MGSRGQRKKNNSRNKYLVEDSSMSRENPNQADISDDIYDDPEIYGDESSDDLDFEPADMRLEESASEEEKEPEAAEILNFDDLPFEVIDKSQFQGVYRYHLLDKLGVKWRIVSRDNSMESLNIKDIPEEVRFGLDLPTWMWVKDGKAMQLFVDGMSRQDLLDALNLEIPHGLDDDGNSLHGLDNTTTLAKRWSRLFRPQSIAGEFDGSTIRISHDLPTTDASGLSPEAVAAVWDGAGVVTRSMLERMIDKLPTGPTGLSDKSRFKLIHELKESNRFEFTIMTKEGQLKGHAAVIEDRDLIWQKFSETVGETSDNFTRDFKTSIKAIEALKEAEQQRITDEKRFSQDKPEEEQRHGKSFNFDEAIDDTIAHIVRNHADEYRQLRGKTPELEEELTLALRIAAGLDQNHYDFLVPKDYKEILRMKGDDYYITFKAPKTSASMSLDVQSNINLADFWSVEQKQQWLKEESKLFEEAVRNGDMGPALRRIDPTITPEKLENWPLMEFAGAGGNPNWSPSVINQILNQHTRQLQQMEVQLPEYDETGKPILVEDKFSLPIPGGRYYVFPAPVARASGKDVRVARGEAKVDKEAGTVWVNEEDWMEMKDAAAPTIDKKGNPEPWGLARILGGMDNDDALWVQEFQDTKDANLEPKLLIWRSPNGPGEYAVLNAHQESNAIPWERLNQEGKKEEVRYVQANSENLFPRIDHALEQGIIQFGEGNIGEEKPNDYANCERITGDIYLDAMYEAAKRAETNKRTLGSTCNLIMVEFASRKISKENPLYLPAPLESIVDASQKTGADTSKVKDYIKVRREQLLRSTDIPERLHRRVNTKKLQANPTDGSDQLSRTDAFILDHISYFQGVQKELKREARPPHAVIEYALEDPDSIKIGAEINSLHQQAMERVQTKARADKRPLTDKDWAEINSAALSKINEFKDNPEQQQRIIAGAWTSSYLSSSSDSAIWALGPKRPDGTNSEGTFHMTNELLQRLGLLDQPEWTKKGFHYVPNARPIRYLNGDRTDYEAIHIRGTTPNLMDHIARQYIESGNPETLRKEGLLKAQSYLKKNGQRDLYKEFPETLQQQLRTEANERLSMRVQESPDKPINIVLKKTTVPLQPKDRKGGKTTEDRIDVYTEDGFRLGRMDRNIQHRFQDGDRLNIKMATSKGGDIYGTAFAPGSEIPDTTDD